MLEIKQEVVLEWAHLIFDMSFVHSLSDEFELASVYVNLCSKTPEAVFKYADQALEEDSQKLVIILIFKTQQQMRKKCKRTLGRITEQEHYELFRKFLLRKLRLRVSRVVENIYLDSCSHLQIPL